MAKSIELNVYVTNADEAIEKANQLKNLLLEVKEIIDSLQQKPLFDIDVKF